MAEPESLVSTIAGPLGPVGAAAIPVESKSQGGCMAYENQASGGGSLGQKLASDPVREGNPVSNARSRLDDCMERISRSATTLCSIADGLYGPANNKAEIVPSNPPRCGEFGMLHDQIDGLSGTVSYLQDQVTRLVALDNGPKAGR